MTIGFSVRKDIVNKGTPEQLNTLHRDWRWIDGGTPHRMMKAITHGYAVSPGHWDDCLNRDGVLVKGYKSKFKGNFLGAHYVLLDFDGGMSLDDALTNTFITRTACFLYTSPSHRKPGKGDRFRIVWALSEPVTDWRDLDDVIAYLRLQLGSVDDDKINAASLLFGSKPMDDNFFCHVWRGYQNRIDPKPMVEHQKALRIQRLMEREAHGLVDGELWEFDKDTCGEDRVALMVHCLKEQPDGYRYVPERSSRGTNTYNYAWDALAGLVHYFGVDLTLQIVEDADWWGETSNEWDIVHLVEELALREELWEPGMVWKSYGTVLKIARQHIVDVNSKMLVAPAMPAEDFGKFKYDDSTQALSLFAAEEVDDEDKDVRLEALSEEVNTLLRKDNALDIERIFPPDIYKAIMGLAKTIPCHPDGLAMLMLPVVSSILGAKHKIHAWASYYEVFILQVCLLQAAGNRKSAQLKAVADPLLEWDKAARAKARQDAKEQGLKDADLPPLRERVQIDMTPEALVVKAASPVNANGFLRRQDEITSLFNSLDQYSKGTGLQQELRLWDGQTIKQARAANGADRIADNPRISTVGTSQPKEIVRLIESLGGVEDSANGLWGRWLFVRPPFIQCKAYRHGDGEELGVFFSNTIERLYSSLDALPSSVWKPTPEARSLMQDANDHYQELTINAQNSFMENTYMKAIGHTVRIAGVIAAIRVAAEPWIKDEEVNATITASDVLAAQHVTEYFVKQASALAVENIGGNKTIGSTAAHGEEIKRLAAYTEKKVTGTEVTARELQRNGVPGFKGKSANEIRDIFQTASEACPGIFELKVKGGKYSIIVK